MKKLLIIFVCIFGIGCTDAKMKQFTTYGSSAFIKCYSGGQIIYAGESTGKVASEEKSDGWYFEDSKTGKLIRVSGDCLIEN